MKNLGSRYFMNRFFQFNVAAICLAISIAACNKETSLRGPTASQSGEVNVPVSNVPILPELSTETETESESDYTWKKDTDPNFLVKEKEGRPSLYILYEGKEKFVCHLSKIKAKTKLFRWGSEFSADSIDKNGKVSPEELDAAVNSIGAPNDQAQGGGYYVSTSILDTQEYGTKVIILESKRDLLVAASHAIRKNLPFWTKSDYEKSYNSDTRDVEKLNSINRGLRYAGVDGVIDGKAGRGDAFLREKMPDEVTTGWINLIHPSATMTAISKSHLWIKNNESLFYDLIRGEEVAEKDLEHFQPKLKEILRELFVENEQVPEPLDTNTRKLYRSIVRNYRPFLIAILRETPLQDRNTPAFLAKLQRLEIAEEDLTTEK